MKVAKWGNSLAVRLPAEVADALSLRVGDELEVRTKGYSRLELVRRMTREEAIAAMEALSRPLPADYAFDRDEANARGEPSRS